MSKRIAERLQRAVEKVSINSVGRSIPATMYEREIPNAVLKRHEAKR